MQQEPVVNFQPSDHPLSQDLLNHRINVRHISISTASQTRQSNPFEEEPTTRHDGPVRLRKADGIEEVVRRKQATLVMFSGGIDSTYALARLLRESEDNIIPITSISSTVKGGTRRKQSLASGSWSICITRSGLSTTPNPRLTGDDFTRSAWTRWRSDLRWASSRTLFCGSRDAPIIWRIS